jgi:hypothetical protein
VLESWIQQCIGGVIEIWVTIDMHSAAYKLHTFLSMIEYDNYYKNRRARGRVVQLFNGFPLAGRYAWRL